MTKYKYVVYDVNDTSLAEFDKEKDAIELVMRWVALNRETIYYRKEKREDKEMYRYKLILRKYWLAFLFGVAVAVATITAIVLMI